SRAKVRRAEGRVSCAWEHQFPKKLKCVRCKISGWTLPRRRAFSTDGLRRLRQIVPRLRRSPFLTLLFPALPGRARFVPHPGNPPGRSLRAFDARAGLEFGYFIS